MLENDVTAAILTFAFVFFALGVVAYAIVRPFTHTHHQHQDNLWSHLP
jgi:Sec-independent protein secretion pathway component TatC